VRTDAPVEQIFYRGAEGLSGCSGLVFVVLQGELALPNGLLGEVERLLPMAAEVVLRFGQEHLGAIEREKRMTNLGVLLGPGHWTVVGSGSRWLALGERVLNERTKP
jgi:hypothetical protein